MSNIHPPTNSPGRPEIMVRVDSSRDLTAKTVLGASWSTLSVVGQRGCTLLATVVLARILAPRAYGLLGMALVFVAALNAFRDLGTSAALIQRKHLTDELASTLFWTNVLIGSLATALMIAAAPIAGALYRDPQVTPVLAVLSATFLITNLGAVQRGILLRHMLFRRISLIQLCSSVAALAVGVGMALMGMGVWSLVGATLSEATTNLVLYWVYSWWHPRMLFSIHELRSVASYTGNLTLSGVFSYVSRNADKALIGRYLGATVLGYYSLAYGLMMYPLYNVTWNLANVLLPAFAEIQEDDERFRRAYLRAISVIASITFPLMLGLVATADLLVLTCFGARWLPMTHIVTILAPVGLVQSVTSSISIIYSAKGRTDILFKWTAVETVFTVAAVAIGMHWGVLGVASAYGSLTFLLFVPAYTIAGRLIGMKVHDVFSTLWPTFRNAVIMMGLVLFVRYLLAHAGVKNPAATLALMLATGIAVFSTLLLRSKPPFLGEILNVLHLGGLPWLRHLGAIHE